MLLDELLEQYEQENRNIEVISQLLMNVNTPKAILEQLTLSNDPQIAFSASLHVKIAGEMTTGVEDLIAQKLKNLDLGQNDRLVVELLKFAPVPDYFISEWIPPQKLLEGVSNPYLPHYYKAKLLERLSKKESSLWIRVEVAESEDTPVEILEQFAGDMTLCLCVKRLNIMIIVPEKSLNV